MGLFAAALILLLGATPAPARVALLLSRNSSQQPANSHSQYPTPSGDGRYVAFESWAGNLAPGVSVSNSGVYVRDVVTGETVLASTAGSAPPNEKSYMPTISANGDVVAFWSQATNLVAGDTNDEEDLFIYERVGGTLTRANVSTAGTQAAPGDNNFHIVGERPSLSADGRFVAFDSSAPNLVADDTNAVDDVFVRDRMLGTTERISLESDATQATSSSRAPAISADGHYVAFWSGAALTPDDVNGSFDVYVYDRAGPTLERIGKTFGSPPAISADGRFVAFESNATDLIAGDTNGKDDVFVYDRTLDQMTRVSVATAGTQADDDSSEPALSADGRYVTFRSSASNLVAGDSGDYDDVFVHDRTLGNTTRVSVTASGVEADGLSRQPRISADGYFVAFESSASNFGFDDAFGAVDLFLAVREDGCPEDPNKLFGGVCGCGVPDDDTDGDGTFDCDEECPSDPGKLSPGACGCETPDGDADGDETVDCLDGCPTDSGKTSPGSCGCGVGDVDTDADGTFDCHDPATQPALRSLVQQATALVKRMTPKATDRATLAEQLKSMAASFLAAQNNPTFSVKQRSLLGSAARTLSSLSDAKGRSVTRRRNKASRALRKLLKTTSA